MPPYANHQRKATSATASPEAPIRAQYGPCLRALCVYLVEQQLVPYGRVREVLGDVFGARLSEGTLVAWVRQGAATLDPCRGADPPMPLTAS